MSKNIAVLIDDDKYFPRFLEKHKWFNYDKIEYGVNQDNLSNYLNIVDGIVILVNNSYTQ